MGCILLSKKYAIPRTTIHYNLFKENITRSQKESSQKYKINEYFFSNITTEKQAYLLGFIYADGCINGIQLNVTLHPKDIEIIKLFIKHISPDRTPSLVKNFYVKFGVFNRRLSDDLRKCGVIERKSLIINFPSKKIIASHLLHHFIRGIFDGDGTIFSLSKRPKSYILKIVGSNSLITSLTEILRRHKINGRQKPKGRVSEFIINNNKAEILKMYKFMYNKSTLYLTRKKEKFEEMKKIL